MARSGGGERGQAANEYVALLALVAVVFLALVGLTAGGLASHVLAGMQRALCTVAPGPCPRQLVPRADLAACPIERRVRDERLSETIAVVALGTSGTLTAVRHSDGRVSVTLADGSSAGVEARLGARLAIGRGIDMQAKAGAGLVWSSGRTWTFSDAVGAARFIERYGDKATIDGKLVDQLRARCSLLCDAIGWRPHPKLPPPDERHEGDGVTTTLTAAFGIGEHTASVRAGSSELLGRKVRRDGETTWYFRLGEETSASLRLPASGIALGTASQTVISYRIDRTGKPLSLGVLRAREATDSASLAGAAGGQSASATTGRGDVVELEASLDLAEPASYAAARGLLEAMRGDRLSALAQVAALSEQIDRHGQIDVRRYASQTAATEVEGSIGLGVTLGGGFGRKESTLTLVEALTRLPGLPFLPRDDCRR